MIFGEVRPVADMKSPLSVGGRSDHWSKAVALESSGQCFGGLYLVCKPAINVDDRARFTHESLTSDGFGVP
jgi:hypothetical protein